jgi:hypothetical protein
LKTISFEVSDEDFAALVDILTRGNISVNDYFINSAKNLIKNAVLWDSMHGDSEVKKICRLIFNLFEKKNGKKYPVTFEELFEKTEKVTQKDLENFIKDVEDKNNGN